MLKKIAVAFIKFFAVCVLFTLIASCSNSAKAGKKVFSPSVPAEEISQSTTPQEDKPLWQVTNKRVCILFGYGYNSPEAVATIMDTLSKQYGASEEGGLIAPIVFPDDFRRETKAVPSDFFELLSEYKNNHNLSGIVLLGAPERTHQALSRLQDSYEDEVPYAVFSFFPQDDVAGMEAVADIVVDKAQHQTEDEVVEVEYDQFIQDDISEILLAAIQYMLNVEHSFQKDLTLYAYAQQILSPHNVAHYVDPETGLRSINHFIFN